MTGMYNVLEKLKAGQALTDKERAIHEKGLVSVLKEIHDDLDREVFAAYGWPADLSDEEILERLVALNHDRVEEERRGLIRWLRPEFQAPAEMKATQAEMEIAEPEAAVVKAGKRAWPKALPEQVQAVLVWEPLRVSRPKVHGPELRSYLPRHCEPSSRNCLVESCSGSR